MLKIKLAFYILAPHNKFYLHTKNHENRTFLRVIILLGEFWLNFTPFCG